MAAGSALKKINARVKYLAKRHPGKKRVTLQKQAGAEYRAGKLGGVKKTVRRVKALHAAEGRAIRKLGKAKRRRRVSGTLSAGGSAGIMGVTFHGKPRPDQIRAGIKGYEQAIAELLVRQMNAKTKTVKKRIQKIINRHKQSMRYFINALGNC